MLKTGGIALDASRRAKKWGAIVVAFVAIDRRHGDGGRHYCAVACDPLQPTDGVFTVSDKEQGSKATLSDKEQPNKEVRQVFLRKQRPVMQARAG